MAKKKQNDYGTGIPLHEVEALARVLLPEIQKFFESEEGQMEFREWKDRRKSDSKRGGLSSGCLPARRFRLKNVINTDDKSEHVPHWEDSVRIIIDWSE